MPTSPPPMKFHSGRGESVGGETRRERNCPITPCAFLCVLRYAVYSVRDNSNSESFFQESILFHFGCYQVCDIIYSFV